MEKDQLFQLAKDPQHLSVAAEARSKREGQEKGVLSTQRDPVRVQILPQRDVPSKTSQLETIQAPFKKTT